jgi:hypothetical protein
LPSITSQAQPLPNSAEAVAENYFLRASTLPNAASIFCLSDAGGSTEIGRDESARQ